jgi:hypothetical protein
VTSDFQRTAIKRLVDKARAAGVEPAAEVLGMLHGNHSSASAAGFAARYPDGTCPPVGAMGCCWGEVMGGLSGCTCWRPVFDVEQQSPIPPASPDDLGAMPRMCGDCAFRKGSPERSDPWMEETLLELPTSGDPFWCHEGMVRPAAWRHPKLGPEYDVPGSSDDWQPPQVAGIPYRADGRPGLLCAGWAARAARAVIGEES